MLTTARLVAITALLAVGLVAPSSAAPPGADKSTWAGITLHGACKGGGKAVLSAVAAGEGYDVTLTTSGLTDGDHWRGGLSISSDSRSNDFDSADFRRVVVDGGWTVTRHLDPVDHPYFDGVAFGPGSDRPDSDHLCALLAEPEKPFAGVAGCTKEPGLSVTSVTRAGSTVVRWVAYGVRPGSTWSVTVSVSSDSGGVAEGSEQTASRRGILRGTTRVDDIAATGVALAIRAAGGQRCTMHLERQATPA